jgi:nondiscriminating aspartyl-tRNA synthetase
MRILSSDLSKHIDQTVEVQGFLNNIRLLGKLNFLILRDRQGFIQVVIQDKNEFKKLNDLQIGSILKIKGKVVKSLQKDLGVEIIDPCIEVQVEVKDVSPIEYYKPEIPSDLEYILDHRPLALRNRKIQAVFKIQAEIAYAYRNFMHDEVEAVEYFPPNMIGASSEGGSEFFNVDYFGHTATLAQSSQLYKQIMVGVNERAFALVPFFRAEKSNTPRHLTEGKQMEFEMGFFDHWHEVLDVQESCVKYIIKYLNKACEKEIKILGDDIVKAPENVPFPRIPIKEAQEIYYQRTGTDDRKESDLSPAAEKELCKYVKEKYKTDFVFITDWATSKRPFYSFVNEKDKEITNTFDLLCAGAEITSGGQRRNTYESMVEGIVAKDMDPKNFEDYLSVFKYGMPPHGGFGMGLERFTMTVLKLKNIREVSLFPSDPKRIAGNRIKAKMFFGGENIKNEIIRILKENNIEFEHIKHEHTPTSQDSARVRNTKLEEGVKSIILIGKSSKKNYHVNIPSNMKIDMKAISSLVGEKCEFEKVEIIKERFGLEVGGVPPFGNLLNLDTFFDERIPKEKRSAFNCGLTTESIVMNSKDLIDVINPKIGNFAK